MTELEQLRAVLVPASDILAELRKMKLCMDPMYRGELARLFESAGIRRWYYSASGLNVDAAAEMLWDRGFTSRRLDCTETLDLLEQVFTPGPKPAKRARKSEISAMEAKLKNYRNRPYDCPDCGKIVYTAGLDWSNPCACGGWFVCRHAALLTAVAMAPLPAHCAHAVTEDQITLTGATDAVCVACGETIR